MYKCTDCDKMYKIKPEYCECGNNIFEEFDSDLFQNKEQKTEPFENKNFYKHSSIKHLLSSLDVVSVTIFIICLILSFLILAFVNPMPETEKNQKFQEKNSQVLDIPNINTLWDDSFSVVSVKKEMSEQSLSVLNQDSTNETDIKKNPSKLLSQTNSSTPKKQSKSASTVKTAQTVQSVRGVRNNTSTNSEVKTVASKPSNSVDAKKTGTKITQIVKSQQAQKADEEWYNYRIALRQALFYNLSVVSINGSGKCQIEFAIDKNGRFINRAFSYQSPNESVNQEVYKMMMKMPSYYPPPDSYNGQKIKMLFSFDNGSYYINYVN